MTKSIQLNREEMLESMYQYKKCFDKCIEYINSSEDSKLIELLDKIEFNILCEKRILWNQYKINKEWKNND